LQKIKAPLLAVNSARSSKSSGVRFDGKNIQLVKKGTYILLPITDLTSGHGTHSNPTIWEILRRVTYQI
jgi:homoserine O-acetyltransferase